MYYKNIFFISEGDFVIGRLSWLLEPTEAVFHVCTSSGLLDTSFLCRDDNKSIILFLDYSNADENLNLPVTTAYRTALTLIWTMWLGSGHVTTHTSDLLQLHLSQWCLCSCGRTVELWRCASPSLPLLHFGSGWGDISLTLWVNEGSSSGGTSPPAELVWAGCTEL